MEEAEKLDKIEKNDRNSKIAQNLFLPWLDVSNELDFHFCLLKIYSAESFIYKSLNRYLRAEDA